MTDLMAKPATGSRLAIEPADDTKIAWWQYVLAIAFVVGLAALVYWLIRAMVRTYGALSDPAAAGTATASATVLVALVTIIGTRYLEGRATRHREQQAKRIPVYEEFVSGLLDLIGATRAPDDRGAPTQARVYPIFAKFTERLVIWGSDDVIREWVDYRTAIIAASEDASEADHITNLLLLEDLFLAIRKDLGLRNKSIRRGDLLRLWINDLK